MDAFINTIICDLAFPDQTGGSVPSPTHFLSLFMMKSESSSSDAVQEVSVCVGGQSFVRLIQFM